MTDPRFLISDKSQLVLPESVTEDHDIIACPPTKQVTLITEIRKIIHTNTKCQKFQPL